MKTLTINQAQGFIGYGIYMTVFLSLFIPLISKVSKRNTLTRKLIIKNIKKRFRLFQMITENEYIGIKPNSGVNFYTTSNPKSYILFKVKNSIGVIHMTRYIKNLLENNGYEVFDTYKENSGKFIIIAQKDSRTHRISILKGIHVKNSFRISFS